jgi:hypothetical protein
MSQYYHWFKIYVGLHVSEALLTYELHKFEWFAYHNNLMRFYDHPV